MPRVLDTTQQQSLTPKPPIFSGKAYSFRFGDVANIRNMEERSKWADSCRELLMRGIERVGNEMAEEIDKEFRRSMS
jgi:hypothetical protein